jgi:hypothetical protein
MKPVKRSVAVIVRRPAERRAARPESAGGPLPGGTHPQAMADVEEFLVVPQPDDSMTQYTACRFTADPDALAEAAARGSLCAQLFLEDNSKKRAARKRAPMTGDRDGG